MTLSKPGKVAYSEKRRLANAMYEEERTLCREERQRDWIAKGVYLTREQAAAGEVLCDVRWWTRTGQTQSHIAEHGLCCLGAE